MIVNTFSKEAKPKSVYRRVYENSVQVKYTPSEKTVVSPLQPSPEDDEAELEIVYVDELPEEGTPGVLYAETASLNLFFWVLNNPDDITEGGFFRLIANVRVWAGLRADFPTPAAEDEDSRPHTGWIYIATDESLAYIWREDTAGYFNICGVTDITVEADSPLTVEYEDENTKAVAKIGIENATLSKVGVVKPDGKTTSVNDDGVLTAQYAVGDVFTTTRAGNPSSLLGYGSWTQLSGVLYGASSGAGTSTGDGKIKRSDLPNVTLAGSGTAQSAGSHSHSYTYPSGSTYAGESGSAVRSTGSTSTGSAGAHTHTVNVTTDSMNGGVTQSEYIPKGVYVYHWLRTA